MNRNTISKKEYGIYHFIILVPLLAFFDFITKRLALSALNDGAIIDLLPIMSFRLTFNTGAAFSFLAGHNGWQKYLFIGIAIFAILLIVVYYIRERHSKLMKTSLILIAAGALGNLIDRVLLGKVIDFISFHWHVYYFPTFNVADIFISVGAVLMIYDAYKSD